MKQLKKHAIGYNTVSSKNGVINGRGVKSKPNNIEVYGYTHEIGTGEKSPDNPYILKSLDSGNVNLYSKDKITNIQVTNAGTIRKGFEIDASKFKSNYCTIYFDEENTSSNILNGGTSVGINIKFLYKNGTYETFTSKNHIKHIRIDKITEDVEKVIIYNAGGNLNAEYFSLYADLMILDSPIMPDEYITDEHSIVLSNGDTTIQVPVSVALSSVEGVSDYIFKDKNGVWKLAQMCKKYEFTGKENFTIQSINSFGVVNFRTNDLRFKNFSSCICSHFVLQTTTIANTKIECVYPAETSSLYLRIHQTRCSTVDALKTYLAEQYLNAPIELVYYLYTPITHVLSDYAQDLLNSFTLQNNNVIFCEGYPDIKISGYIQK